MNKMSFLKYLLIIISLFIIIIFLISLILIIIDKNRIQERAQKSCFPNIVLTNTYFEKPNDFALCSDGEIKKLKYFREVN